MPIPFPRIRLVEFHEQRLRKPIVGSLLDEQADTVFTERIATQLQRWQDKGDNILFSASLGVSFGAMPGRSDDKVISMAYSTLVIDNHDLASIAYGM